MDNFLEIIYAGQFEQKGFTEKYEEFFKPTLDKLKSLLSPELYEEIETQFIKDSIDNNRFYAVEAMKLAIGIMDGTYVPYI